MAETIWIHSDTFHVQLALDELHRLPRPNWIKICQYLSERSEYHLDVIQTLRRWFPINIDAAKIDCELSRAAFEAGYKDARRVPKDHQHEQMLLNAKLRENRHAAVQRVENLKKHYEIFEKMTKEII